VRGDQRRDGGVYPALPAGARAYTHHAGLFLYDGHAARLRDPRLLVPAAAAVRDGGRALRRAGLGGRLGACRWFRRGPAAYQAVREFRIPGATSRWDAHPSAWCLIVFPSTTNTTSSAMLVARSATRSRLRLTRNRSIAAPMMCGSSIMWVRRIRNTERFRTSTESSLRRRSRPSDASQVWCVSR